MSLLVIGGEGQSEQAEPAMYAHTALTRGGVWNFDLLEKAQEVGGLLIVLQPLGALFKLWLVLPVSG